MGRDTKYNRFHNHPPLDYTPHWQDVTAAIPTTVVKLLQPIYHRLQGIQAQLKKDTETIYLHTVDTETTITLGALVNYALEWFADTYTPIESTPPARLEADQPKRCKVCNHPYPIVEKPHR